MRISDWSSDVCSSDLIERVDLATGRVERLYDACDGIALEAPNDIVFDADGRMWFTDIGKSHDGIRTASGLFSALPDGSAVGAGNRQAGSFHEVGSASGWEGGGWSGVCQGVAAVIQK